MSEQAGLKIFVGPANQLEMGSVSTGPAAAVLTPLTETKQRLDLTIPAPTTDLVNAAQDAQAAAALSATEATGAKTAATNSANSAASSSSAAQTAAANAAGAVTASLASAVQEAEDAKVAAQAAAGLVGAPAGAAVVAAIQPGGAAHGELSAAIDLTVAPLVSGPDVVINGDSLNAQGGGLTPAVNPAAFLAEYTGLAVHTNAVGGETSAGIAARQGGNPYLLLPDGGAIPASGGVKVNVNTASGAVSWPLLQTAGNPTLAKAMTGSLAGVPGTLSLTQPSGASTSHQADDYYTFTRTTDGADVAVRRPVAFYSDFALARRGDIHIIQAGRNNFSSADQVLADIAAMVEFLSAADKRYLIVGVHNGTGEGNPSTAYTNITSLNTKLRNLYGRKFIDYRTYLISYGLADAGITLTADDAMDIAADTVPRSLLTDGLHFQIDTRKVLAHLEADRLYELRWTATAPTPTPAPNVSVSDNFNRADSENIGPFWMTAAAYAIAGNKLTRAASSSSVHIAKCTTSMSSADHKASVVINRGTASTSGLVVRYVDDSNFYAVRVNQTLNNVLLYKMVGGVVTTLSGLDNQWISDGSTLTLEVIGTTLKAYVNGTQVLSTGANDSALVSGTVVGIRCDATGATLPTFDDFTATSL